MWRSLETLRINDFINLKERNKRNDNEKEQANQNGTL